MERKLKSARLLEVMRATAAEMSAEPELLREGALV